MLGLKRGTVKIIPFQSQWHDEFIKEKKYLFKILKINIDIEHVGSTAVEGMLAKPIIDIIIGLAADIKAESIYNTLSENGYQDRGDIMIPGDRLFVKGPEKSRTHHLHIVELNSVLWNNYILFRDYLNQNKTVLDEYNTLKKELAKKFPNDRDAYTNGKADFINYTLKKAKR